MIVEKLAVEGVPQDPDPIRKFEICVITTIHPPWDARVFARETVALADEGWKVAFISTWATPELPHRNIQHLQLPVPTGRKSRLLHGFRTFRAALSVSARAYHFHDLDFVPFAILLYLLRRIPVVYDCHENYPEEILHNKTWIPPFLRPALADATRCIEWLGGKVLGHVIVPVPTLVAKFEQHGARVCLVRNLAKLDPMKTLDHERGLLFLGTISESYGISVLLDLARQIHAEGLNIPIYLTEKFGGTHYVQLLQDAIETENLDVRILPRIAPNELWRYARLATVGLALEQATPERVLAIPTKLFEYMAFGLPVVATNLPLTREVVETAQNGFLVEPRDVAEILARVKELHSNPELYHRLQENGFDAVNGVFSWEVEREKLIGFFRPILQV